MAIVNGPRQHDRFVLIGLYWLYGRSEFLPLLLMITLATICSCNKAREILFFRLEF